VQSEGQSSGRRFGQGLVGVVEIESVKSAQPTRPVAGLDQGAQLRDVVPGGAKHLLFGQKARRLAGLASLRPVLGIGHACGLSVFDPTVLCHLVLAVEKDNAIFVGAHFKSPAKQRRRRGVAIAGKVDEALDIDYAAFQCVHGGDIDGQWPQCGALGVPKLNGTGL
jgi:hypothetical protein